MDFQESSPIAGIQVEGEECLAVDTGLSPAAFAQAKLARYVVEGAALVVPGLEVSERRAEGVVERDGRMLVRFPAFEGERLDLIVSRSSGEGARGDAGKKTVNALRRWMDALTLLRSPEGKTASRAADAPVPAAALIAADGSVLFLPTLIAVRAMEGRGPDARLEGVDKWIHPDLVGDAADAFTASALAYRILCGTDPFEGNDADALRANMRDGCALPARLVRPDLDDGVAALLDAALVPAEAAGKKSRSVPSRPSLQDLNTLLGAASSRGFYRDMAPAAHEAARTARARLSKTRGDAVNARRFLRKNSTVITVIAVSVVAVAFAAAGMIRDRAGRPTTKGMIPVEVVRTYYGAFGRFDHETMDACVVDKAGRNDIDVVTNLFVISRVRQAYENRAAYISASEWIAAGSLPFEGAVYGVDALRVDSIDDDASDGEVSFKARYDLWRPADRPEESGQAGGPGAEQSQSPFPLKEKREDLLVLELRRGAWRISSIERKLAE